MRPRSWSEREDWKRELPTAACGPSYGSMGSAQATERWSGGAAGLPVIKGVPNRALAFLRTVGFGRGPDCSVSATWHFRSCRPRADANSEAGGFGRPAASRRHPPPLQVALVVSPPNQLGAPLILDSHFGWETVSLPADSGSIPSAGRIGREGPHLEPR